MNPARKATFFGEFARLSGAGIPVTTGLRLLLRHAPNAPMREALRGMEAALAGGAEISEAMQPALTPLEHGIIRSAEKGGQLAAGFAHLEHWYEAQAKARSAALHAMAYPLVILHAAAVIPAFVAGITSGGGVLMPVLLNLAGLWLLLAGLWAAARLVLAVGRRSALVDTLLGALPWIGPAWRNSGLARWAAVLQFHVMSGQRFSEAFREAGVAAERPRLNAASRRLAAGAEAGRPAGDAMADEAAFPESVALHFASAEAAGTLDRECALIARRAQEDAVTSLQRAGEWVPRLVYFAAMLFAAWQILRMGAGIAGQYQNFMNDLGF